MPKVYRYGYGGIARVEIVFQGVSPEDDLVRDEHLYQALRGEHSNYAPLKEFLRKIREFKRRKKLK